MGIACITAFIKTSRPAWDSNFSFQPFNFFQILSFITLKDFFLFQPTKAGKPKYYWTDGTPRKAPMAARVSCRVFELKKILVFAPFILWPDACSYLWRTYWICTHSEMVALQKTRLSSAKSKWEMRAPFAHRETPYYSIFLGLFKERVQTFGYQQKQIWWQQITLTKTLFRNYVTVWLTIQ